MSSSVRTTRGEGSPTQRPIRVLHVDDESGFAEMVASYLERADDRFEIETATSADQAAGYLAQEEFDCVVSDYEMPGRDGIEFLRSVREDHPDLPFILYTGKGSEEVASDAISAGATDYLQKESGTEQYELLANRVRNAVARAQSQQAERHLRELAENTDHILYSVTPDWEELLFINSAYEEVWGRSIESLRADPTDVLEGVHPEDRATVRERLDRVTAGETVELECRVNADEEFERWVRLRGEPVVDDDGEVVRVAGFATDITHRKELQTELEERTNRLQEAQRVAGVGSWEWDARSDTVVWSDETYRIFGRDPEELTDPSFEEWLEGVHPDDRDLAGAMVEEAMETGSFPTFEHRVERPDGSVQWVKCRGDVTIEDGRPVQITGTILDISDRREAGADGDGLPDGLDASAFIVLDPDGRVTGWNDAASATTGYDTDEVLGEHVSLLSPGERADGDDPEELLERAVRDGVAGGSVWLDREDGSRARADVVVSALLNGEDRHEGYVCVVRS